MITIERFTGGAKAVSTWGLAGIVGLVLTAVGFFVSPEAAFHSYLVAFAYWCGLAVGSLLLLAIFHTAKAKWPTVLRRPLEAQASSVGVFALLFLPLLLGLKVLFPWVDPVAAGYTELEQHHLHHKHAYLNVPFFIVRQIIYFGIWWFVANRLHRWSLAQDEDGSLDFTVKARRFAPGTIPFLALAMTFAAFDWLMSLTPLWQSTMFGVYYFAGSFLGTWCLLTIVSVAATGDSNLYGRLVTLAHYHNLGKFMLAFTAFWAYIGFSQFMLIWIANLPEEAPWYAIRANGAWRPVSIFLFLAHFVLPFVVLLSRDLKLKPRALRGVAFYLLFVHFIDIWWLVYPKLSPERIRFHWTLVTAFVGVGGIAVAYGLTRFRNRYTVPIKDPYIADSLRYVQP